MKKKKDPVMMVILQRGWVFVGRFSQKGNRCTLRNGVNYRYQGSGSGFGFVAKYGPTANCKIDKCELPVSYNELTEVARLECDEVIWNKLL